METAPPKIKRTPTSSTTRTTGSFQSARSISLRGSVIAYRNPYGNQ